MACQGGAWHGTARRAQPLLLLLLLPLLLLPQPLLLLPPPLPLPPLLLPPPPTSSSFAATAALSKYCAAGIRDDLPHEFSAHLLPVSAQTLVQESEMTCLMNYLPEERGELQSAAMEARAREQRDQISALHDRWGLCAAPPLAAGCCCAATCCWPAG